MCNPLTFVCNNIIMCACWKPVSLQSYRSGSKKNMFAFEIWERREKVKCIPTHPAKIDILLFNMCWLRVETPTKIYWKFGVKLLKCGQLPLELWQRQKIRIKLCEDNWKSVHLDEDLNGIATSFCNLDLLVHHERLTTWKKLASCLFKNNFPQFQLFFKFLKTYPVSYLAV